ncbi:MAG: hypothetical protein M3Y32_10525 [Pseudomonadota bacterium]|nr:hypothetical protein [Pseudomonadota bacterium]
MYTKSLITAAVALASTVVLATSAMAADADPGYPQAYPSQVSRTDVQQQTAAARAWGQLRHGELPLVATDFETMKTRGQVHAEALEAIRLGAISHGEFNAVPTMMQLDSIRMAGERAVTSKMASL